MTNLVKFYGMNRRILFVGLITLYLSSCSTSKQSIGRDNQTVEKHMIDPGNSVFTEIEINATPEQVWSVLTDWDRLKEWSSSFVGISSDKMVEGEIFISYFKHPLKDKLIEFEHVCTEYVEGERFGWSGRIVGKAKDHHIYAVVPAKNQKTIFRQEDGIHGSSFINFLAEHQMTKMYNKFNEELKKRVESLYPKSED